MNKQHLNNVFYELVQRKKKISNTVKQAIKNTYATTMILCNFFRDEIFCNAKTVDSLLEKKT